MIGDGPIRARGITRESMPPNLVGARYSRRKIESSGLIIGQRTHFNSFGECVIYDIYVHHIGSSLYVARRRAKHSLDDGLSIPETILAAKIDVNIWAETAGPNPLRFDVKRLEIIGRYTEAKAPKEYQELNDLLKARGL